MRSMPPELIQQLRQIDARRSRLDAARPLPPHTASTLRDKLALEWTFHSNAIEGNTLTLRETQVVLEGITVGGKSLREHAEAINHHFAIGYLEECVAEKAPLDERLIKDLHALVLKGIDPDNAGRYRRENVVITGASTTPPNFLHLEQEMRGLLEWYSSAGEEHAIVKAAQLHTRFVKIHPFVDGNGRTGRLLLNLELMKEGYPPAVIRKEDRLAYYESLDLASVSNDYGRITALVAAAVARSIDSYLELLPQSPAPPDQVEDDKPGCKP